MLFILNIEKYILYAFNLKSNSIPKRDKNKEQEDKNIKQLLQNYENTKRDITFLKEPGVYEILDIQKDLSYYGETDCLLDRMQMHYRQLKNGTHPCKELLESFSRLPLGEEQNNNFKFFVIVSGVYWADPNKRREFEKQLIEKNKHRCYNQTNEKRYNRDSVVICPIMYKGKYYESVRGALRDKDHVKISRTTLIRYLQNPNITDVYYIEGQSIPHGSLPIFARKDNGPLVLFQSINAAIRAGFAKNKREVQYNLENNINSWRYAHVDKNGKPLRTKYQLKSGEISYEMYLKNLELN